MLGGQQAGRQILGISVDRVSEQEQLHDRKDDDQAKRHRIAPHLDPFLAQERAQALEGQAAHLVLSPAVNWWIKTSSRRGSTSCHASSPNERIACSSSARSVPPTCSAR